MSAIRGYPKVFNVGHRAIADLFADEVIVQEKVDGSQFSFGLGNDGLLRCRSKNCEINIDAPDSMFAAAVETAKQLAPDLVPGWTYRGEYLKTPKHNHLAYDRIPARHIVLFDIQTADGGYMHPSPLAAIARIFGLESVPVIFEGKVESPAQLEELIKRTSYLGGQQIEGVVIKNYARFGQDGHPLFGKHVREDFKEAQNAEWKTKHKSMSDIRDLLGQRFRSENRWKKAVQHLRDDGRLTNSPSDIGELMREVQKDLDAEVRDEVALELLRWAFPHVKRVAIRGLAEWYKQQLLEQSFAEDIIDGVNPIPDDHLLVEPMELIPRAAP